MRKRRAIGDLKQDNPAAIRRYWRKEENGRKGQEHMFYSHTLVLMRGREGKEEKHEGRKGKEGRRTYLTTTCRC